MDSDYVRGIERSDTAVFRLLTQSSEGDRRSLLDIQNIVRAVDASYVYLEVGSHLGGTLLPHLMDPLCRVVVSVDPRPASQADERGRVFHYERNSTSRMIRNLETIVPRENMLKLRTFDVDISDLSMEDMKDSPQLAFIDGEHTNRACFRDFVSILPMMQPNSIVAFT